MKLPIRPSSLALAAATTLAVANVPAAPVGSEFQVNQGQPTGLIAPSLDSAADQAGNFVVVWESNNDVIVQTGDEPGIEAALYDAAGNLLPAGVFSVNTTVALGQTSPSVAMNATGNIVVVWEDPDDGNGTGVFGQRFDSTGAPVGLEFLVPQDPNTPESNPQVAVADNGSFMVAWMDSGQIEARWFNNAGAGAAADTLVSVIPINNVAPAIAVGSGPTPEFVVAWSGIDSSTDIDGGIFFQRFDATGGALGGNVLANSTTTGFQTDPALSVDTATMVIAWEGPEGGVTRQLGVGPLGGPGLDIAARLFDAAGNPQDLDFLVNTTVGVDEGHASVAVAPSGNFVIAWSGDDADGRGLYYSAYDAQGTPLPGESDVAINTTTALNQEDPEVAMDGNGNFVAAWRGEVAVSTYEIFAQRYSSPFTPVALVDLILEAKAEGKLAMSPFVLLLGALFGLLAWLRRTTVRR